MGRSILDDVFLAQESLEWAIESGQDLVLPLFDFEKAFEKIEWGFFFTALSKLGFSPQMDKIDFIPIQVSFLLGQGQWRTRGRL
jgi:hypothetical protein